MKRLFLYSIVLLLILLIGSCASKTREQIQGTNNKSIQLLLTRNLVYQSLYKDAEEMYIYIKESHPKDVELQVEVDYEIAFIYLKRKKYDIAKEKFEALIAQYDLNKESNTWPQWPYYLSKTLLKKKVIPQIEAKTQKSKT